MSIKFNGINNTTVTFKTATAIAPGVPVKVSAAATVDAAGSGDSFCGVAVNTSGNLIGVQISGYAELAYTSTAPTVGYCKLIGAGDGKVKVDNVNGREYLVVDVDTTSKTVGIII